MSFLFFEKIKSSSLKKSDLNTKVIQRRNYSKKTKKEKK